DLSQRRRLARGLSKIASVRPYFLRSALSHDGLWVFANRIFADRTCSDDATASIERVKSLDCGAVSGLKMIATRARPGGIPLSRSSHLPPTENSVPLKPVRLPLGFGRLATKPCATGSGPAQKQLGRRWWLAG